MTTKTTSRRAICSPVTDVQPLGLPLHVLRPADYVGNGITAHVDRLTLIGWTGYHRESGGETRRIAALARGYRAPFTASEDAPAVALEIRIVGGELIASIRPVTYDAEAGEWVRGDQVAAGGCYASTHDSRLAELVRDRLGASLYGALAVHDFRLFPNRD